ncbi:hypothetical protein [Microbacterium sp. K41]|uniref:hypothetical protein n=1 Tax=Microbacterium sp. K41 TaxID=2305437 RepID=UPI00109BF5DC|nr:hypothetical protein [Microbacterium sp. K41]
MNKRDSRPIEVGDRFEPRDSRDAGKIVVVVKAEGLSDRGRAQVERIEAGPERVYGVGRESRMAWARERHTTYRIRTEAHPNNRSAVGRTVRAQENTLRDKYKRVSS